MKRFFVVVLLALSVLAMGLPASSRAAEVTEVQYSDKTAYAFFATPDPSDPCITTNVSVQIGNDRIQEGGRPETPAWGVVAIEYYDSCTDTALLAGFGRADLPPAALHIDQRLDSAMLDARFEFYDFVSQTSSPVDVSISWRATSDVQYTMNQLQIFGSSVKYIRLSNGTVRLAEASGTVSLAGSPNLTPQPSVHAQLASLRLGSVRIIH